MIVNRIEPLDKRRSKVFLDGDFAFVLYKGELRRYQIEVGRELTEAVYQEILEGVIGKRARERALYLLKFSGRTEAELRKRLKSGFYPEQSIDKAIEFLKRYQYLDDYGYARNYIEVYGKHKSVAELKGALREKGIEKEQINSLLEELEPDEEGQIRHILEKRRRKEAEVTPERMKKDIAYLMRKGYSYEKIRSVIGDMQDFES